MSIQRINQFPEGSGSLSNDDIFLFMDDPSSGGVTKKISLNEISNAIGGGGGGNPFQVGNIDLHNGGVQSAQILQFNDVTKQSVITGPTPVSGENSQRIIIQGQRAQGNGEGGDVYLWGGDSDINGGDIKIYAGDADNNAAGYGGYVNIDGGNGYNQGGNVTISAGNSTNQGGSVNISAGAPSGNVSINTAGGTWLFKSDNTINIPNNTIDAGNTSVDIKSSNYVELQFQSGPSGTSNNYIENPNYNSEGYIWTAYDGTYIENYRSDDGTNPSWNYLWEFRNDGNLQIPGNILLSNGTSIATGTYYNGTSGGNNGISLNCSAGYELNWQGGHLKNTEIGDNTATPRTIYVDSPLHFPGSGTSSGTVITSSGIEFPDGSIQSVAWSGSTPSSSVTNFNSSVSGLLPSISGSGYVVSSFNNNIYRISVTGLQPSGNYANITHSHTSSNITDFTEAVQDVVGANGFLVGASGITISYNDNANSLTITGGGGGGATISNASDNRLLTSDGTSTGINAESNLTFDGTSLIVSGNGKFNQLHPTVIAGSIVSSAVDTDVSTGQIFDVTLTENITLNDPTNPVDGVTIRWRIVQDGTGGRTVTLGGKFVIPSSASSPLPWSTTANKMDTLAATYHAGRDKWDVVAFVPGY